MMFIGSQTDNTDIMIACGVIVDLGILAAILLRHLVLAEIESVIGPGPGSHVVIGASPGGEAEQRQRSAKCRGQPVRRSIEERARVASRERMVRLKGLNPPGGATATGQREVAPELDGEMAGAAVVAELRERVGQCVWVGLRQGAAMPEDEGALVCNG
jgi:hypothetical protein